MRRPSASLLPLVALVVLGSARVGAADAPVATTAPAFDAALARSVGADDRGMRSYVFVLLRTGPVRVPDGAERDRMFEGHFANIERLAAAGKLVLAGPFDGVEGWRGMFVFASEDIEEVRKLVAGDPVIQKGEMVAQYHQYFASAALMLINDLHRRIERR
jgi:uncharacterized protein YciI